MSQRSILTSHFHVLYILRKEEEVNVFDLFFIPLFSFLLTFLLTSFKQVTATII